MTFHILGYKTSSEEALRWKERNAYIIGLDDTTEDKHDLFYTEIQFSLDD